MPHIDATYDACPIPVVKAKKALEAMDAGTLEITVGNETAVENLSRLAASMGCGFDTEHRGDTFLVRIEKQQAVLQAALAETPAGKTVVVLSAETMGSGDDDLGRILMKGFIFALTQLDTLPAALLLYNSGARLSAEGSPVLGDLQALAAAGVEITTCGTCLDYFGLKDKLLVGTVSNMYSLVETMASATRILRP